MNKRKLTLANNPLLSGPPLAERDRIGIPYRVLSLSSIESDPTQPRTTFDQEKLEELAASIKAYGVLSPILVRPGPTAGRYMIISGERRFRAAKMAGLSQIPVIVDHDDAEKTKDRTLAIQLVENLQRADLTPLERAQAIGLLRDTYSLSVRDIAERLGVSKSMVQRSLEILELPPDLLNALKNGASESKVLLLSQIEDVEIRSSYLKDLDSLTRNELEKSVKSEQVSSPRGVSPMTPEDRRISDELQRSLGLKVKIQRDGQDESHGRLVVEFYSDDDLQEVFRRLVAE